MLVSLFRISLFIARNKFVQIWNFEDFSEMRVRVSMLENGRHHFFKVKIDLKGHNC